MDKLSVLLVDASPAFKRFFQEVINATDLAHCDQMASTYSLALERLRQKKYDCILLELTMEEISSVDCLRQIKNLYDDIPVIMLGEAGETHADQVVRALEMGAFDFIVKPSSPELPQSTLELRSELKMLFAQIQTMRHARQHPFSLLPRDAQAGKSAEIPITPKPAVRPTGFDLLLIASSTGGPRALETIVTRLPLNLNIPILAVQHMPPVYTRSLAASLNKKSLIEVLEASDGTPLRSNVMLLAPGGYHMRLVEHTGQPDQAHYTVEMDDSPLVNGVRPAADVLFESIARLGKKISALTVILTGMGSDGLNGVRRLKQNCICHCITQSESTCAVYGMPKSVHDAGLSDESADLYDIAERIAEIVTTGG